MEKLVLIDGNSLLNRVFYATPVFTTKNGQPTNAVFGFTKLLLKILSDVKPKYIVVAFDLKAPTFRHNLYDGYKATRKAMPEELAAQLGLLKNLLSEMGVAMCAKEGIEADDVIGTLSKKCAAHSYIYTGDMDSYQLVDEKTDVFLTKRGVSDLLKLNAQNFKETIGVDPKQIVDLKALMGDKSDNIPGVPGIGEKTARELIERYGSLDGVYENIGELKGALKDKLLNGRESAYLSYKLALIDRNCDVEVDLDECLAPLKFSAGVRKIFAELEFKSLMQDELFEDGEALQICAEVEYPPLEKVKDISSVVTAAQRGGTFAVELRSEGLAHIFYDGIEYELIYSDGLIIDWLTREDYVKVLSAIFSNQANTVVIFDCKTAMHTLASLGIEVRCAFDDLSLVEYLCGDAPSDGLKALCMANLLNPEYGAFATQRLFDECKTGLANADCIRLYDEIERPLVKVLYDMETGGVRVSSEELNTLGAQYRRMADGIAEEIYSECGMRFNINSPSQLGEVLFEKLGLKTGKKSKNGKYSTNADVLESLSEEHPVAGKVLKYRFYQKLLSTYIEGLKPFIDRDGFVHTTYKQTITSTGRLSSTNPNLQNIPIREEEGRELRKVFVPREGNIFIDADYSQIELRLLAHFSGCKELIEAYNEGKDIHAITASQVFDVPLSDVTQQMRRDAKAVNFGIIYGISDFGLARNLKIPIKTAKEYIERYFITYSAVKEYMNLNIKFAREHGYVSTLTGRRRSIPEIKSPNANIRQFGERAAMNMPLQGSSADIIKIAMNNVHTRLAKEGFKTKLILQVHDELVLDAPESEARYAAEILKYEMENAVKLSVPLTVEVHSGKNWYDTK